MLIALLSTAHAGGCDALVESIPKTERGELSALLDKVVSCDKKEAEKSFKTFVRASGDVDTLVDLSLKAIGHELYQPVWDMPEQLTDYKARTELAQRVGGLCQDQIGVLPFLQGGYIAANDRAFRIWSDAMVTCGSGQLADWLRTRASDPPSRTYDDKYSALLDVLVKRDGPKALKTLVRGAVVASERGGPFTTVLEKMSSAVAPKEIGGQMDKADKDLLADAYVAVGTGGVRPEQAALVADRLFQNGYPVRAASLLKVVYGDRVQADGTLLYGVASIEHCGGRAVIHLAEVYEPSQRWSITNDVTGPARRFKARLKCETPNGWDVVTTPSPVTTVADVEEWGAGLEKDWTAKKLVVKIQNEKALILK